MEVDVSIEGGSVIRRLSVRDVDVFRRIRLEALSHEPLSFASVFGDWVHLSDRAWRQHLDQPVFVAFLSGQPVGMMGLRFERARKMAHRARLVSVYVRKSERGTRIAADLLHEVTEHARNHGVLQLELAVNAENSAAIRFYERHGFVEVGRIPNGFLGHDVESDELIMVLRLRR
ncbi:GNAT family N-acetyltransferase [Sinorhizobium meliloti]|uniref:GNAT family N-acetyltransferase n=1 Tax=Rhizobium meliloti TaxID=382 RepID=UPI000B4A2246|nr:GNAT family N-acetyltransferase [Sinorhizobium meliloti]ASQ12484.1 N-acetyltransferase [Sinorhizobium meliloti]MDW9372287.1 GNAT family N-acetyltransferase [Sinorhizobium meliloti]MDW9401391.1 GNAT family N-acetyltransferase [Sinorhizobium meliloti]MDW9539691.1 GNAT family N-acetyltransferase [Sinorhizobium meliloti]MQU83932.1 GNAT family N-acetyltransferase [Sinorhizobium meliloti]